MKIGAQEGNWVNRNVMEILVKEEIDRQIRRYPSNVVKKINLLEVATYALNRLPALYASSQQGFNKQKLKGRAEHSVEITQAVRRGFAAVQQDLLRYSVPLIESTEPSINDDTKDIEEARKALQELAKYLPNGEFSWSKIVKLIKPYLAQANLKDASSTRRFDKITCNSSSEWVGNSSYRK
ncbi:late competence development ComFB family protein [Myxosarcina sp. GI1]|uniref:late competence development ComFB family protein n=1 Tax=Myxosarcina sp. GI1 TaxID=1541065 RepID=UPI0005670410|nr:late competence development ComFB family protein [Myxosarcina sp. GI1]